MSTIERHAITSREQWVELRKQDCTASTIGALFAVHPYITALRLYAEKRGTEFLEKDDLVLARGRDLEPAFPNFVRRHRPDWRLEAPGVYLRDPEIRLGATPDFYIHGDARGLGVLQCKTVAPSVYARDWLGGSEIPFWITLQALTEMMLADAAFGAVGALLVDPHNMDVAILDVPRHPDSEAKIIAAVAAFWICVETGTEPDPDFSRDAAVIKALTPRESPGKSIDFSGHNELPAMLEERAELMNKIKNADDRCDEIETEIKFLMGDAESANGLPDWRITYKVQDRKEYLVKARSSRVLLIKDKRPQTESP